MPVRPRQSSITPVPASLSTRLRMIGSGTGVKLFAEPPTAFKRGGRSHTAILAVLTDCIIWCYAGGNSRSVALSARLVEKARGLERVRQKFRRSAARKSLCDRTRRRTSGSLVSAR